MTEIKISDISIGDWISDKNGIVAQVRGIECWSDGYVVNVRTKARTITNLTEKGVCPIPLLPEILEKNGFVKKNYDNGKMWDWCCDNVLVRKFADEDIYRFIVVFNSKHYTTMMVVGKHTHQLQHALRLGGVGKEIEL